MPASISVDERLDRVLARLVDLSKRDYYNPYQLFQWPDAIPEEQYWMSPELMSVHGTAAAGRLTEAQLWRLSKWESVNFYSLNVHGIRELLLEIVSRIHTAGFEQASEYFHHVIGEENEHMWFFAEFCLRYGKRIYPNKSLKFDLSWPVDTAHLLVFTKLLILEEIVDYFNQRMGADERLHPTIRQINAIHHQDESRHIAFGHQIVALLYERLGEDRTPERRAAIDNYIRRYIDSSLDSFVAPAIFVDAGIDESYEFRREVLADPAYHAQRKRIARRSVSFLTDVGVLLGNGAD